NSKEIGEALIDPSGDKLYNVLQKYQKQNPQNTIRSAYHFNVGGVFLSSSIGFAELRSLQTVNRAFKGVPSQNAGPVVVHGHPDADAGKDNFDDRLSESRFVDTF